MQAGNINKPDDLGRKFSVPRSIYRDKRLSLGAVGLYCFLLSHSKSFQISIQFCVNSFKDGKDAIRARFNELIEAGYLEKMQVRDKKTNKFLGNDFIMTLPRSGKSVDGKPADGKSATKGYIDTINKKYKGEYFTCYKHLILLFDESYRPKDDEEKFIWLDAIEQLDVKENINPKQVYYITKKTLEDDFWRNKFQSPVYLLQKNNQGVIRVHGFKNQYAKNMKS